jgi:hypothetical protein
VLLNIVDIATLQRHATFSFCLSMCETPDAR